MWVCHMLRVADSGRSLPAVKSLQDVAAEAVASQIQRTAYGEPMPNPGMWDQAAGDPGVMNVLKASRARAVKRSRNAYERRRDEKDWHFRARNMLHPPVPPSGSIIPENHYHDMRYMVEDDHGMAKHMAFRSGLDYHAPDPVVTFRTPGELRGFLTPQQEMNPEFLRFVRQRLGVTEAELPDHGLTPPTAPLRRLYQLPLTAADVAVQELHADFVAGQAP